MDPGDKSPTVVVPQEMSSSEGHPQVDGNSPPNSACTDSQPPNSIADPAQGPDDTNLTAVLEVQKHSLASSVD